MSLLDWSMVAGLTALLVAFAVYTKRFNRSVADFLVANRCAGRYMLGVSEGITGIGAISIVAMFEAFFNSGFSLAWWMLIINITCIVIALTGWVVYRYRETNALTLAQLLEERYSKKFRITAGLFIFVSGIINFGIFPSIGARFFMSFCSIPSYEVVLFGSLPIDVVYAGIMLGLIAMAVLFVYLGGQISVIITDFVQGCFFNVTLCVIACFLVFTIPWEHVVEALSNQPVGESMLHPFRATKNPDFNVWYYLIQAFGIFYTTRAWQGNQGYFGSAINAQEAKMGNLFGWWRIMTQNLLVLLIPIFIFAYLKHPAWLEASSGALEQINAVGDETIRTQTTTTIALSSILPIGLVGAFCAAVLAAFISTHDTYLHSWGSIFIQDVLIPLRKDRKIDPKQHVKWLRGSILGVALFIFIFSLFFPQNDYILMFFALSGTIWLGGAGAIIIGALYWSRGTTKGAYSALYVGLIAAVIGFVLPRVWEANGMEFPVNSQVLWMLSMVIAVVAYVVVSLLDRKPPYNLNRLLNRSPEHEKEKAAIAKEYSIKNFLGLSGKLATKDKVIYAGISGFMILVSVLFIAATAVNLLVDVPESSWVRFWQFFVWLVLFLGVGTTVWFTIGGIFDARKMFDRLKNVVVDDADDGTVDSEDYK